MAPIPTPRVFTVSLAPGHESRPEAPIPVSGEGILLGAIHSSGAEDSAEQASRNRTDGAGLLPFPGPVYYTTDQLSKRPEAVSVAELDTAATQPFIVKGTVVLKLRIDERGQVADVEVETSDLPAIFAETAANAFRNSLFTPGERNGQKVNTLMRIEVRWDDPRLPNR